MLWKLQHSSLGYLCPERAHLPSLSELYFQKGLQGSLNPLHKWRNCVSERGFPKATVCLWGSPNFPKVQFAHWTLRFFPFLKWGFFSFGQGLKRTGQEGGGTNLVTWLPICPRGCAAVDSGLGANMDCFCQIKTDAHVSWELV